MRSEIALILLGCLTKRTEQEEKEFDALLRLQQDWAWITGQLIRHRVSGNIFASMTKEQQGYIVPKVCQTFELLRGCYEACNRINLSFSQKLIEKLNALDVRVAGLKGMVFNTTVYPLSARKSNDIDILVAEDDLVIFDKVIREMGFIQSLDGGRTEAGKREKLIQRMNYHDLVPYFKRIDLPYMDCIKVDVNFHFDSKEHDITKAILDEGVQFYEGNGYRVQGLNWTTHLLHLCVHFYREASNSIWTSRVRDVDLYKLVDIENSLRLYSREELLKWTEMIKKFELEKPCYFTFFYLNEFYPSSVYREVMDIIKPDATEFLNQVTIRGGEQVDRREDFMERTFNMNYGRNFAEKDFSKGE